MGFGSGPVWLNPSVSAAANLCLWLILIYFGVRLLIRSAYGLFRLLVALIFGPVALILWRVILPLAQPVRTTEWGEVWQRARAALCPESDPVVRIRVVNASCRAIGLTESANQSANPANFRTPPPSPSFRRRHLVRGRESPAHVDRAMPSMDGRVTSRGATWTAWWPILRPSHPVAATRR